ncbi:major facilitator superfamily domain-containing protein [Schizophyllum amplum]|uniref:Major facilitator superfamily domain-containing protein n=1 Tax=Schizophyllum amplum TaxID=97359 RepID=A0A550BSX9_9AGAR|nr:major facilitator superfamily domain-containing protein [Auriculariopsis ampla]
MSGPTGVSEPEQDNALEKQRTPAADDVPLVVPSLARCIMLTAVCTTAMAVNISNTTAVSIALPTIGRDFGIQQDQLQWITNAYALSSGCLLLTFGRIADVYGRKKTFLGGALWLFAFTLACGFVNDFLTLAVLRGLQGVGSSATIPAALGILAHAFPPSKARSLAFATFGAGAPVGGVLGFIIAGALTQYTSDTWRAVFYFCAALAGSCFVGGLFVIGPDPPSQEKDKRVDWLGSFLVTAGLTFILFILGQGEVAKPKQWGSPYIIVLLILGVFFIAVFMVWQSYLERLQDTPNVPYSIWTPPPLMRPSLFARARGRYGVQMAIAFLNWCAFLSWQFWAQLFYQEYQGYGPMLAAVRFIPMFVTGVLCNVFVATFVAHVSIVYLMAFGTLITSIASLLFAVIDPNATYWAFGFPAAITSVFGADFVFAGGSIFIAKLSRPHEQSVSGGLYNTMIQLGTSIGIAVSTVVYDNVQEMSTNKGRAPREAELDAYHAASWTAFAFGILASLLAVVFLRGVGVVGHKENKTEEEKDEERTAVISTGDGVRDKV